MVRAEPVIEVLAETAVGHQLFNIPVGTGDGARGALPGVVSANCVVNMLFEQAEKLDL